MTAEIGGSSAHLATAWRRIRCIPWVRQHVGSLTANFIAGVQVSLLTSPTGLQLSVDGDTNYSSYDFIWGAGTTHTVAAAATQTASNGRVYTFQNWSNQGAATQTVSVTASMNRLTASYNELSRVVVQSTPPGLTLQVDGSNCVTPCNVDRANGATFTVAAPNQIPMGSGARLDFNNWSDGGASNHTITVNQNYATLTASYSTLYQLSASSTPGNGSAFKFSPSSSDMFYTQGTQVIGHGHAESRVQIWTLDGSAVRQLSVGIGHSGGAEKHRGEHDHCSLHRAGWNHELALAQTPSTAVAPGSIISIFGQSLASEVQVGPVNPLSQTLAGTSVTINSSILPLMFVSPQQINAQLPSNLPDGNYTLEIQNIGQPANFRNLDGRARRTGPVHQHRRNNGLCDGVSRERCSHYHQQPRGCRAKQFRSLEPALAPIRRRARWLLPAQPASRSCGLSGVVRGRAKSIAKSTAAPGFAGIVNYAIRSAEQPEERQRRTA